MDCGKSTLALQMDHNHKARGRIGRIFTSHDRAGESVLSSRLGLAAQAIEVRPEFDFWEYVVSELTHGGRIDYVVCDEAQFYSPLQIEQLARLADELQIDVFCFGIRPTSAPPCSPARPGWWSSPTGWNCSRSRRCAGVVSGPRTTPVRSAVKW